MSTELVTIATTEDLVEAEFLRNHLQDKGFEVFLADDNIVGVFSLLAPAVGWIKIKVLVEEAADATALVNDLRNSEVVYDENFPQISE